MIVRISAPLALLWLCGFLAAEEHRLVVAVPAREIGDRPHDECPAEFALDARDFLTQQRIDLSSLEVRRWNTSEKKAEPETLPARWYDAAIPYEFEECDQNVHVTDGKNLTFVKRPRWGDFYNIIGDGRAGRLVWRHKQQEKTAAYYEIRFKTLPEGQAPAAFGPRSFVGDGSHRCAPTGHSTTGLIHSRIDLFDWNADGLVDVLLGQSRGHVLVYLNQGTPEKPLFVSGKLVHTSDGRPLDVGWSSTPKITDWDGDGRPDMLSGCERNRVLWYRNVARSGPPVLELQGFVLADGKPIELPIVPVPKSPPDVYPLDYYPMLEVVDWNGDGRADLLAGGFITGRIFLYENLAAEGPPQLTYRGPIEADGQVLNVGDWAASPCVHDFDRDGDLDLVTGNMPLSAVGGDSADAATFLKWFENVGSRTEPRLTLRPFPRTGQFPISGMATPRAADWDADGDLDLAVSASESIYLYKNTGTAESPRFAVHPDALPGVWSSSPLPTWNLQVLDWDDDGRNDLLGGYFTLYRERGPDDYERLSILAAGNTVSHTSPSGDPWTYTHVTDLDADGRKDILYGTHDGHVWWHRNVGGTPARFDETGERLETQKGPIHVGLHPEKASPFDLLQGSRTTVAAADFDADGLVDLLVGDTYGKVRQFRNRGPKESPRFDEPVELGDQRVRNIVAAADWDSDGKTDAIASSAGGPIEWYRNLGGRFSPAERIQIGEVPYSPMAFVADWNKDGDPDLIVGTAYGFFCWFERSFIDRGYARAEVVP